MELPQGELVSGSPILILLRLSPRPGRLAVKFWIKDCQTRATVDGPRWLLEASPEGEQPSLLCFRTQVTLPLGCLEVSFEAIALDLETQRESRKTRITRSVVPPHPLLDEKIYAP
jgi:hypothetical protein